MNDIQRKVVPVFPQCNNPAPDLKAKITHGEKKLSDYKGKWLVLFSSPADVTPESMTEFMVFTKHPDELPDEEADLSTLSMTPCYRPAHGSVI